MSRCVRSREMGGGVLIYTAILVLTLAAVSSGLLRSGGPGAGRILQSRHFSSKEDDILSIPKSLREMVDDRRAKKWLGVGLGLGSAALQGPRPAKAVGNLFEVKSLPCVIQDVSFNVPDSKEETKMFKALFQDTCYPCKKARVKPLSPLVLIFMTSHLASSMGCLHFLSTVHTLR